LANATATAKKEIINFYMDTFYRSIFIFYVLAAALFSTGCTEIRPKDVVSQRSEIDQIVKNLGDTTKRNQDLKENISLLQQLKPHSKIAVAILLEELKPVAIVKLDDPSNASIKNREAHHVMWCFRALYYLTGQKILAYSSYKLTDSEYDTNRSGLAVRDNGKWAFFTEWMSRGTVYFAPIDAQEKIIRDWKIWAKQNLDSYSFPQNVAFDEWYFGGPE
jgi:hypothetical protein